MTKSNIEISKYLISSQGILATLIFDSDGSNEEFRLFESMPPKLKSPQEAMRQAARLFEVCGDPSMRIIVGSDNNQETIVCHATDGRVAVVIVPTGHEVMKSIRRMLTRALKSSSKPLRVPAAPRSVNHAATEAVLEQLEAEGMVERVEDKPAVQNVG